MQTLAFLTLNFKKLICKRKCYYYQFLPKLGRVSSATSLRSRAGLVTYVFYAQNESAIIIHKILKSTTFFCYFSYSVTYFLPYIVKTSFLSMLYSFEEISNFKLKLGAPSILNNETINSYRRSFDQYLSRFATKLE